MLYCQHEKFILIHTWKETLDMRLQLTDLSREAYQTISSAGTDFLYAVDYLQSGIQIREFMPSLQEILNLI